MIRVLIFEDSAFVRFVLKSKLSADPSIEIAGTAINGKDALFLIETLKPDVITLDVEMPEVDGLTTLKIIREKYPDIPIIMCSNVTMHGGEVTIKALLYGASDYVCKPSTQTGNNDKLEGMIESLISKIKTFTQQVPPDIQATPITPVVNIASKVRHRIIDIVVIGTSTGGPSALSYLIPQIPRNFVVPILIVQHMPEVFTKILANDLNETSQTPVVEASEQDELLTNKKIWLARGNHHLVIKEIDRRIFVRINQDPLINSCRPSVDVLFQSVANVFGNRALGVILTGMGTDGLVGCQQLSAKGSMIIAQDKKSSVIWGMPGVVAQAGIADKVLALHEIPGEIIRQVGLNRSGIVSA